METIKKNGGNTLVSASMEEWLKRRKDIAQQLLTPLANHLECQISAINFFIQDHYNDMKQHEHFIYIQGEVKRYEEAFNFLKSLLDLQDEMDKQLTKVQEKLNKVDKSNASTKA
jgi:hypothetical protein